MRYRILKCVSPLCAKSAEGSFKCPWKAKVLACLNLSIVNIFEIGQHLVRSPDPPSGQLSKKDKAVARSLAEAFVKPVRIRNRIADENGGAAPSLNKLQNFVAYYRKSKMDNSDDMDALEKMIWAKEYTGTEMEADAFTFSIKRGADGSLLLGEGIDIDEFFVGYTTKALLWRLDRGPATFIFHVDATFKLSQVDYNTFVCGISDKSRVFHLVGKCVSSQRTESQYTTMFASLKDIYLKTMIKPPELRYVTGDADKAQFNAVSESLRDIQVEYLMCFWHMIKKSYMNTAKA